MFPTQTQARLALGAMIVTGIILVPAVMATPAVQDLTNLRTVINAAASTIGEPNNPNRGFGFFNSGGQMGTADLINNITSTLLRSKFQIDTNKTAWLNPVGAGNATNPALNTTLPSPLTPTLPLSSSLALPSTLPTSTPSLDNVTMDLSTPYIDYVSSIPNLSTSLIALGRAWHREMNAPVSTAIGILQESITTLQTTMLQNDMISSSAVLRTVRASSSLESAQQAWSRFLNLPGSGGSSDSSGGTGVGTTTPRKRVIPRPIPANGRSYTHKELWGRKERSREDEPGQYDVLIELKEALEESKRVAPVPFDA